MIDHKAPATLFKGLLQQAELYPDPNPNSPNIYQKTLEEDLINKILTEANTEEICWEYLKCLLENSKIELFDVNDDRAANLYKTLLTKLSKQEQATEDDLSILKLLSPHVKDVISKILQGIDTANLPKEVTKYVPGLASMNTKNAKTGEENRDNSSLPPPIDSDKTEAPLLEPLGDSSSASEDYPE